MIVISGALVLVALVLLVIGLIDPSLGFVYASIAVSLASFAFLVVGILQRRKEVLPEMATVPTGSAAAPELEGITAILPTTRPAARVAAVDPEPAAAPAEAQREDVSGQVLVVAGRPRYHVGGCRYLTGKDADAVDVADAREEGFTACGVCKPDLALESGAAQPSVDVAAPDAVAQVDEVEVAEQAPVTGARVARADKGDDKPSKASRATKAVKPAAPVTRAATTPPATPAAASPATPPVTAPAAPPIRAAKAAPASAKAVPAAAKAAAAKTSPAKKAATAPVKRGVVVIPDRGKFHTPECRYVRGAEDTLELTRAAATRQGYQACGVCNP